MAVKRIVAADSTAIVMRTDVFQSHFRGNKLRFLFRAEYNNAFAGTKPVPLAEIR